MSYEDHMADLRSDLLSLLLERDLTNTKFHPIYWEWKELYKEYVGRCWCVIEGYYHSMGEATNYIILDDILRFDLDDGGLTNPKKLAEILKIDSDLFQYCDLQVSNEGIFGALKYKTPLTVKTEIIKQAITLLK